MMDKNKSRLEKRCFQYIRINLRAPSASLVNKWGKKFGMTLDDIKEVNDQLQIRHQLGIDRVHLPN